MKVCNTCKRECELFSNGKGKCNCCQYIHTGKGAKLMYQMMLDIGVCQVCNMRSCEVVWDNIYQDKYSYSIEFGNPLSFMEDRTAICPFCMRHATGRSLAKFGTIYSAMKDHPKWKDAIAKAMVRQPDLPLERPTVHAPGSMEKIEVLRRRAEQGYSIFHPGDNLRRDRAEISSNRNPCRVDPQHLPNTIRQRNRSKIRKRGKELVS